MSYIDRGFTLAAGLNRLSTLMSSAGLSTAFHALAFIFPPTNAGSVGVGDSSMSALPANAYAPGTDTTYPPPGRGNPWQGASIYLWAETAGDVVFVRGDTL
jgi:hypothetical protein